MNSDIVGLGETPVKQSSRCNADEDYANKPQSQYLRSSLEALKFEENGPESQSKTKKRDAYISWDDYFMAVAVLSAQRSKDPSTQVGACIVNPEKKIVGIGYNGFPIGCSDDELPWSKTAANHLDTKYPYVCHAEMNAILNKNSADVKNCTIYVALFPCNECAKLIIQAGIKHVIYMRDRAANPAMIASKRLFDMAAVKYTPFKSKMKQIVINFETDEVPYRMDENFEANDGRKE